MGMKRVTMSSLVCALIFGLLATWLGPKMISYWYTPPVAAGAASAFNCTEAVNWAMNKLVLTQLVGTVIGVVVGLVLGIVMRRRPVPPAAIPPATKVT
jgi:ABC-type phosphate/phosphonate transport system permease subunit